MVVTGQLMGRTASNFRVRLLGGVANSSGEHRKKAFLAETIPASEAGFTLLELLVAMTVSAILIAVAVPTYRGLVISNRLTTATNEFVAAINIAKIEAIRRNRPTQFCSGDTNSNSDDTYLGTACAATAGAVYVLEPDGSTTTKLYEAPKVPSDINLSMTGALRFGGQGLAQMVNGSLPLYSGLLVDLSSNKLTTANRRCIYVTTGGAISTCSITSINGCPTSEPSSCQ